MDRVFGFLWGVGIATQARILQSTARPHRGFVPAKESGAYTYFILINDDAHNIYIYVYKYIIANTICEWWNHSDTSTRSL